MFVVVVVVVVAIVVVGDDVKKRITSVQSTNKLTLLQLQPLPFVRC